MPRWRPSAGFRVRPRRTGYSRGLTRAILRGQRSDVFRSRQSSLDAYLPWLEAQWAAERRNGAELWRSLKQQGFRGCLRVVAEWAARRRQAEKSDAGALTRVPSARTMARLLTVGRDRLSKAETVVVAAIEGGVTLLVEARGIVADFQAMIRGKSLAASPTTRQPSALRSLLRGPTGRLKARSRSSSSSSARCMDAASSTFFKLASLAQPEPSAIKSASEPILRFDPGAICASIDTGQHMVLRGYEIYRSARSAAQREPIEIGSYCGSEFNAFAQYHVFLYFEIER